VLVPGGFGDREVQEKFLAAKYVREFRILPFAWTCKITVIEFARSIVKLHGANSTELSLYSEVRKQ